MSESRTVCPEAIHQAVGDWIDRFLGDTPVQLRSVAFFAATQLGAGGVPNTDVLASFKRHSLTVRKLCGGILPYDEGDYLGPVLVQRAIATLI